MSKRNFEVTCTLDNDCICVHTGWSHLCEDPGCPSVGLHTEHCTYPDCGCGDYLDITERYSSVKQAMMNVHTDVVRHNSVDMEVRGIDTTDIKAAYEDRHGKKPMFRWSEL